MFSKVSFPNKLCFAWEEQEHFTENYAGLCLELHKSKILGSTIDTRNQNFCGKNCRVLPKLDIGEQNFAYLEINFNIGQK
jgi:hypothetical protein